MILAMYKIAKTTRNAYVWNVDVLKQSITQFVFVKKIVVLVLFTIVTYRADVATGSHGKNAGIIRWNYVTIVTIWEKRRFAIRLERNLADVNVNVNMDIAQDVKLINNKVGTCYIGKSYESRKCSQSVQNLLRIILKLFKANNKINVRFVRKRTKLCANIKNLANYALIPFVTIAVLIMITIIPTQIVMQMTDCIGDFFQKNARSKSTLFN
jgi:hypothetical protein